MIVKYYTHSNADLIWMAADLHKFKIPYGTILDFHVDRKGRKVVNDRTNTEYLLPDEWDLT